MSLKPDIDLHSWACRPRPLSRQTAHQLGLYHEAGIPPLVTQCVGNDLSVAAQRCASPLRACMHLCVHWWGRPCAGACGSWPAGFVVGTVWLFGLGQPVPVGGCCSCALSPVEHVCGPASSQVAQRHAPCRICCRSLSAVSWAWPVSGHHLSVLFFSRVHSAQRPQGPGYWRVQGFTYSMATSCSCMGVLF